jgi:hypothetical protein
VISAAALQVIAQTGACNILGGFTLGRGADDGRRLSLDFERNGVIMTRFYLQSAFCLSAVALASVLTGGAAAEDELFTRIKIDTVFNKDAEPPPTTTRGNDTVEKRVRVLNVAQLGDLLKEAGMEPEVGEAAVSVKTQHSKWTFTSVLGLDENRQQIVVLMRLLDLEGKSPISAERLTMMLTVNRDLRPAMFTYSEKNKRLELLKGLDNDQISGRMLRDELKRLAQLAENMAPLWEVEAAPAPSTTAPAPTSPAPNSVANKPAPQPAAPAPAATNTMLGQWLATRSAKEAFAMQLNADNSFTLVYVKDGKQSKSTGKYTLTGSQLSLSTNDGGKFSGSVTNITSKSFDFTAPNSASKLTFQKAS